MSSKYNTELAARDFREARDYKVNYTIAGRVTQLEYVYEFHFATHRQTHAVDAQVRFEYNRVRSMFGHWYCWTRYIHDRSNGAMATEFRDQATCRTKQEAKKLAARRCQQFQADALARGRFHYVVYANRWRDEGGGQHTTMKDNGIVNLRVWLNQEVGKGLWKETGHYSGPEIRVKDEETADRLAFTLKMWGHYRATELVYAPF